MGNTTNTGREQSGPQQLITLAQTISQRLGVAAFPLIGKIPPRGFAYSTLPRQTPGLLSADRGIWRLATGFALIPLLGSDVFFIDSDDAAFTEQLLQQFPKLVDAPQIQSGTPGHCNFVVRLTLDQPIRRLSLRSEGREVGSLRGGASYIVGPGSQYPSGNRLYTHSGSWQPPLFSIGESERLLHLFARPAFVGEPQAIWLGNPADTSDPVETALRECGYRERNGWLNGRCIQPERHQTGDRHPSFGFNIHSGRGFCYVCGSFSTQQVAAALGVSAPEREAKQPARPFAYIGNQTESADDGIQTELNITTELIRRRKYQSARMYGLLFNHARSHHGQHSYQLCDLIALGADVGLTQSQVNKAIKQMVEIGLLGRTAHGRYRRISLEGVRRLLGLNSEYALASVRRSAYSGTTRQFNQAVLLDAGRRLPPGLSTATIAAATGRSRRTVYYHENDAQVERQTRVKRTGLATATPLSFIRVFDAQNRPIVTVDGKDFYKAAECAARQSGKPWGWSQRASLRFYQNADFAHAFAFSLEPKIDLNFKQWGQQQAPAIDCRRKPIATDPPDLPRKEAS